MPSQVPEAEMLLAPGCAHCPGVLAALAEMLKHGDIARLTAINIHSDPDAATDRGVRSVPWIRIGPFELTGAHTRSELQGWAERAASGEGMQAYLVDSLENGRLDNVIATCRRSPQLMAPLLGLAADLDTPFTVRIGIGAVLEDLGAERLLADQVEGIAALAASPHPQVRADAAHYLGLVGSAAARERLQTMLDDDDAEVREIAAESLADMDERDN